MLETIAWQKRVKELEKYQQDNELSLRSMAEELNCSIGKLSYELTLAQALDKFPELHKMKYLVDAIKFIKKKKFKRDIA